MSAGADHAPPAKRTGGERPRSSGIPAAGRREPHSLLRLQHAAGNRATGALLQRRADGGAPVLRSAWGLPVSQPDDASERAADRAARHALDAGPVHRPLEPLRHPSVHAGVPDGAGAPLPGPTRAEFEHRFGADLSGVRLHTGAGAARAAHSVAALAYAAGRNVVWGAHAPSPLSAAGRELLAHELAHVVQQGEAGTARLQRTCVPASMCPIFFVSLGGSGWNWQSAEICLQNSYPYKGIVGSNHDWRFLTAPPGSAEQRDLDCFKSHLMARSGMFLAQPDIIDFTRAEIYDVTTAKQAYKHHVRLWADTAEATALAANPDCSGSMRMWKPGTWQPPSCWWLGGDLYMLVINENGLLLYDVIKDISKELVGTALLAAMAAAAKNQIRKKLATAAATRVPHLAAAMAAVMVVVLITTDAEASFGGDGDPIEGIIKALEASGESVPQEIKDALRNDPDLRAKIEAAAKEKNPSERAKKLSQGCMEVIARNKDKFSREEIEVLTTMVQVVGDDKLPGKTPTVEALKAQAEAIRSGKVPDPGGPAAAAETGKPGKDAANAGQGDPAKPGAGKGETTADIEKQAAASKPNLKPDTVKRIAAAPELARRLLEAVAGKAGTGKPLGDADVLRLLGAVPADFTQAQYDRVAAQLSADATQEPAELLANLEKHIAAAQRETQTATAQEVGKKHPKLSVASREKLAKASPAARRLLDGVAASGVAGVELTDDAVDRFLAILNEAVELEQVEAIVATLSETRQGDTIDSVLTGLEKAVKAKAKPRGQAGGTPGGSGSGGTGQKGTGTVAGAAGKPSGPVPPEAKELAKMLVMLSTKVKPGETRVEWDGKRPVTGTVKTGARFFGKLADGTAFIARVTVSFTSVKEPAATYRITAATALYDLNGSTVVPASPLVGMTRSIVMDPAPPSGRR